MASAAAKPRRGPVGDLLRLHRAGVVDDEREQVRGVGMGRRDRADGVGRGGREPRRIAARRRRGVDVDDRQRPVGLDRHDVGLRRDRARLRRAPGGRRVLRRLVEMRRDHREVLLGDAHRVRDARPSGVRAHQVAQQRRAPRERVTADGLGVDELRVDRVEHHARGRDPEVPRLAPRGGEADGEREDESEGDVHAPAPEDAQEGDELHVSRRRRPPRARPRASPHAPGGSRSPSRRGPRS